MGLIRELVDEVFPLPIQATHQFPSPKMVASTSCVAYALVNLFFQMIDCVLIPFIAYLSLIGTFQYGWFFWIVLFISGVASIFSWSQVIYYFLFPVDNYVHPFVGRLMGETAIGTCISAFFKIPVYASIK